MLTKLAAGAALALLIHPLQGGDYDIDFPGGSIPTDPAFEDPILQALSDMKDFLESVPGGGGFGPPGTLLCGHFRTPLDTVNKLLSDFENGDRNFGGISDSGIGGATDGDTTGINPGFLGGGVPAGDLMGLLWHEGQHSYYPTGAINNCDHAELHYCTLQVALALAQAGVPLSADFVANCLLNIQDYQGRCNW